MFYMLYRSAGAEDDGSAWEFEATASGYRRVQKDRLTVQLLDEGRRAFGVGGEIVIDEQLGQEVLAAAPEMARFMRSVDVIGPQPKSESRPAMKQLLPQELVYLARESVVDNVDGAQTLRRPFVLDSKKAAAGCLMVCKIAENGVTIVSEKLKELLASREPRLSFHGVRYDNEDAL